MIYLSIAILVLSIVVIYLWIKVGKLENQMAIFESNKYLVSD